MSTLLRNNRERPFFCGNLGRTLSLSLMVFPPSLLKEKNNQISSNEYNIKSNQEKITNNKNLIIKIKEEESKDKIYKMYLVLIFQ